ncbi:hypothetical protein [Branchiibius hedensis]|uniref:TY-Chap2 family putative peptide chaperone n=1 Tax=Branchiibius hedensis TaxID=672460 RepID=UPI000D6CBB31|nr:hypothetical protein [Branchiibius hedensis]
MENLEARWDYWEDKGGGNGISSEVAWLVTTPEFASEAVAHRNDLLYHYGHPLWPKGILKGDADFAWHLHPSPPHVVEALAWSVAAQLVRRHPLELTVGAGPHTTPNAVTILSDSPGVTTELGHFDPFDGYFRDHSNPVLQHVLALSVLGAEDPRERIRTTEERIKLVAPQGSSLPPSTPRSLSIRWIAQFLLIQLGSREHWFARGNGIAGWTLGAGLGERFEQRIVLNADSTVLIPGATPFNLASQRQSDESMTALVARSATTLLP